MEKKMTIEELAVMVKHGFDSVDKRFESVEKRFVQLEHKMDVGFEGINRRIDLLHEDISDLPEIREEVQDLGIRMDRVEKKVAMVR